MGLDQIISDQIRLDRRSKGHNRSKGQKVKGQRSKVKRDKQTNKQTHKQTNTHTPEIYI